MVARITSLRWCLAIVLSLLIVRLAHLQLLNGDHYRQLAERNRLRVVPKESPRGLILDRNGELMASNQTIFRVAIIPQELESLSEVLSYIAGVVDVSVDSLKRTLRREQSFVFVPATIVPRISKEVALQLEEDRWKYPGLFVNPVTVRRYPQEDASAHILGYLSQPTEGELSRLKSYGVLYRQLIGRTGLENLLDSALRGQSGGLLVEVDHRGRQVRVVGERKPQAGNKITLTVDANLQSLIADAFGDQAGASVVLDPNTGAVIAMVSTPSFEPEAFAVSDQKKIRSYLIDQKSPLMNRATQGLYQPGSTAKLVTAALALEQGLVKPEETIFCPGHLRIGNRVVHCWNKDGHGAVNLRKAIRESCNVYFMQLGRRLGANRLREGFRSIGFGRRTGWPMEEAAGNVGRRRFTEGDVVNFSIGQGDLLVTVLQNAIMISAIANGGWLVKPWVVQAVNDDEAAQRQSRSQLGWGKSTFEAIYPGMRDVVAHKYGTGHRAVSDIVTISGKTGTAQTHVPDSPHGWFIGFCPSDEPKLAMAIVTEHGGSGGDLPAVIANNICEYMQTAGRL